MTWNGTVKKLAVQMAAVSLVMIAVCNFLMNRYRESLNRESYLAISNLIGTVREAYPEMPEDALMRFISGQGHQESGRRFLESYGIFSQEQETGERASAQTRNWFPLGMNLTFLLGVCGMAALTFHSLYRRQKRVYELGGYLEELVRGNYELDIRDNGEDELSRLKNEVYKLTVFFREQAENAAKSRRALADSVADISHQLKTPLTSVTVLVDNLLEPEDMDEGTRRRFLMEISSQLSGVSWLVGTLLKLSRLDAGVVELEEKPLRLNAVAEEVVNRLELGAELKQVEFRKEIPEEMQILGDARWLTEALLNVVKNAVEHSETGGMVSLRARENPVYTELTVQNWGRMIPPQEQKHLFERFYRGRGAGKESVGIGLALTKEILKKQNGSVSVESTEDKGTIFTMKFYKCH